MVAREGFRCTKKKPDVIAAINRLKAGYGLRAVKHGEQNGRLARMKRLRYQRLTHGIGLIMSLAIGTVADVFGYYGGLVWRFFFD